MEQSITTIPTDKPEIITTRLINAPRDLIFKLITTPDHVRHFWGPSGFSNKISKMDVRVGGEWLFNMIGPDGTDWPNRVRYLDVRPPEYLAFVHDGGEGSSDDHRFNNEIHLVEENGGTRITMKLTASSISQRDSFVSFGATEGGKQNLARLDYYASAQSATSFVITRDYPVSVERLFKAFTDVEDLKAWAGPAGSKTIKAAMDLRAGGTYHYGLEMPDGSKMWGKQFYKDIVTNERLIYIQCFSNEAGGITAHPMAPTWPKEILSTVAFESTGEKSSKLTVTWTYTGNDNAERATFDGAHVGMKGGWTGSLDKLYARLVNS